MAQINKPTDYFNTKLYTGNGSTNAITGVGFQPDWVWIKSRNDTGNHNLFDVIRGTGVYLRSNATNADSTDTTSLTSFDTDGFTLGSNTDQDVNKNTINHVAWNWLASNTTASNTDGSITSTVSANTTSGFSIVGWTGSGANATIGHGLGVAPKMIIIRRRTGSTTNWIVYHESIGNNNELYLNLTNASTSSTRFQSTSPTSSVFSVSSNSAVNESSQSIIAYCFAEKKGFSKFGSYTGNGSADGTFVYTGFKPAFLLIKRTDATGFGWSMFDNKRDPDNVVEGVLNADTSSAEDTASDWLDFTAQGFKIRFTGGDINASGGSYIYMAFASQPLVGSNNVPATAR